ncbi:MAG: OmpH family outer membrane protein [Spirochaetaceae bacterium]|jgi:outer membrane protein|nr:OmpH family outer membrane protein [Spirochaetaceae bacterium]
MKKMVFFLVFVVLGTLASAQQLTRFAVVDLAKVYTSFLRDSRAVREFEERSARVQADIDKYSVEIQQLKSRQATAQIEGRDAEALRLDSEIYQKSEYLRNYYEAKTAELEDQRKKLSQSDSFVQQVYSELQLIAESEGYTMVLNLTGTNGILWYSPTVDITAKVIESLRAKAGR